MPKLKKATPLPKESMSSIWNSSFEETPGAGESSRIHDHDYLSSVPVVSGNWRLTDPRPTQLPISLPLSTGRITNHVAIGGSPKPVPTGPPPRYVPIGLPPSSSCLTIDGRPKHIPIILEAHPDLIGSPYAQYAQPKPVNPVSPDAQISSRTSFVQRLDSKQPSAPLPSMTRDVRPFSESTQQVQATPNPFSDPMSEISLVTTFEAPPQNSELARVVSRFQITGMVNQTVKLRRIFIIALVAMQLASLSTSAVVAIIFEHIRNGIRPGIAAWLVASLTLLAASALAAVIIYWKREKLMKEGGEEFEMENQQRGQSSRAKDQRIKELEEYSDLMMQQVSSLRKKVKHLETKLQAALGQEDLENAISPRQTRTQSWLLQSSRTAVSDPAPATDIRLPSLNFNVTPQQGGREPVRSEMNTGAAGQRAGGTNLAATERTTSATEGWETVIGSDDADREARLRRLRPGVMKPDELRLLSTEERMAYFAERRRQQQARLMGERSAFI